MANRKSRDEDRRFQDQTEKAVRRGEKFAKTLNRIVAESDRASGNPAERLLKAVELGLDRLRRHAEHAQAEGVKKAAKTKAAKAKASPTHSKKASGDSMGKARPARAKRVKPPVDLKAEASPP